MPHNFLIHSSVDRHLGCLNVLAIVGSATVDIGVHASFLVMISSWYMLNRQPVRACCMMQETQSWCFVTTFGWSGGGRAVQEGGDTCTHMANSGVQERGDTCMHMADSGVQKGGDTCMHTADSGVQERGDMCMHMADSGVQEGGDMCIHMTDSGVQEGGETCMHMADSCCCVAKTITIL